MVLLAQTPGIISILNECDNAEGESLATDASTGIDHRVIADALKSRRHVSTSGAVHLELDSLLGGTGSKEYLDLMERLRREVEEKEYYKMVPPPSFADPVKGIVSEVSSQIAAIFNILFSAVFTALAVWYATGMSTTFAPQITLRVVLSASTCLLVVIAEVVLYMSYLEKVDSAATKEKRSVEVKKIHKTWELDAVTGQWEDSTKT